jgi:hypothetical protein
MKKSNGSYEVSRYSDNSTDNTDIAFTSCGKPHSLSQEDIKCEIEEFLSILNEVSSPKDRIFKYFYERLYYAAKIGLEGESINEQSANKTIRELKKEFVAKQGLLIRNSILRSYGVAASVSASLFFILATLLTDHEIIQFPHLSHYFYVIAGSSIGSWISLAIRTRQFSFEDIRQQANQYQSPSLRIIFISLLSFCLVLFIDSEVIKISIGDLQTARAISGNAIDALVLGIFFGLFEQVLVSKIKEKSESYLR